VSGASPGPARLRTARRLAVAGALLLGACVVASAMHAAAWPRNLLWTAVMLVPLALPLPGLLRGHRRTCAWATLCVAPYVVYAATEVVANPDVRGTAGAILFASLAWFAALVHCLRVSSAAPIASAADQVGPVE
jgi:uncharacterized membrane protein